MSKAMLESDFYHKILKPNFEHAGYFVQRFEQYTIPDMMVCKNKRDTWLEIKTIDEYPKNKGIPIRPDWRIGQLAWLKRYRKKGGFAYLALWIEGDVYFLIPQEIYTRQQLTSLSRGIVGGIFDKGSNE